MRFYAIVTDPLDFSRALRLKLGFAPDLQERERFLAAATVIVQRAVSRIAGARKCGLRRLAVALMMRTRIRRVSR